MWRARLDTDADRRAMLATLLSADERERAGRFVFDRDRDRYVVGRGSLRMLLGRYLKTPPAQLRFTFGPLFLSLSCLTRLALAVSAAGMFRTSQVPCLSFCACHALGPRQVDPVLTFASRFMLGSGRQNCVPSCIFSLYRG